MSILAIDVIERLPNELAQRLMADSFFADIPVIVADEGNVLAEMAKKQAAITTKSGKRGIAVVVLQVIGDDEFSEVNFGPLRLRPAFLVVENRELNIDDKGTGKSARKVARKIVDLIKTLAMVGMTTDFVPDSPCIEPINLKPELGQLIAYQVNFMTVEADTESLSQVTEPAIAVVGQTFTIACATAGAVIWFTTDDSYPAPTGSNPTSTATPYTSPVAIPDAGVNVRACAYLEGKTASRVARVEIVE
jgi:hypothetical protein